MKRKFIFFLGLVLISFFVLDQISEAKGRSSGGSVSVRGYTRKDGTYVAPHMRSAPDGNFYNNWSTKGNVNPYTGQEGTKVSPPADYKGNYGSTFYPLSNGSSTNNDIVVEPPQNAVPISLPQNAKLNYFGNGWECEKGYARQGNSCERVSLPQNAKLNYFGNGWECEKGYARQGNSCERVSLPQNAKLNYFGNGWECEKGYARQGNSCERVSLPQNAKLNYFGNGWECEKGYARQGNSCERVSLPQNAKLNYFGNGWECEYGYARQGNSCERVASR